jgi:hypothetical protein
MASSKKILSANWFESLEILFSANFLLGIRKPVQPGQSSPGCGSLAISLGRQLQPNQSFEEALLKKMLRLTLLAVALGVASPSFAESKEFSFSFKNSELFKVA